MIDFYFVVNVEFCGIFFVAIATAAIEMLTGDTSTSRKPEIVSDAAYLMLCKYVTTLHVKNLKKIK